MGPEYGRSTGPQISGGAVPSERSVMTEMPEVSERAGIATRNVYRAVHIKQIAMREGYLCVHVASRNVQVAMIAG